ncbi:hypothetical protein OKW96_14945 [Sphingobacterium sp. KU25419]|nr:hypothetical protein OKW96_14945 [Sphingobacterium sp. KU25419]
MANNQKRELAVTTKAELFPAQHFQPTSDQLEQLDFKALKASAKSLKIPAKVYNSVKPTLEGYSKLINLIRSQKNPTLKMILFDRLIGAANDADTLENIWHIMELRSLIGLTGCPTQN